jgi:hypothetical protein
MAKATFQELFETVTRIESGLTTINERCSTHYRILEGHTRTLYGANGNNGVVGKQEKQDNRIKTLEENRKDIKEAGKKWKDRLIDCTIKVAGIAVIIFIIMIIEHWAVIKGIFGL